MRIARSLRATAVVAALSLTMVACGGDEPTAENTDPASSETTDDQPTAADLETVTAGTLTVCSEVPYAPFEVEDPDAPSGYSGFDIDLMDAIAGELGLSLAVVNAGFDDLTSGAAMAANTCDVAASAMTITPERAENVDFSDGYYNAAQSLMVKSDSGLTALADLEGKTIGVQSGTTGESYANDNNPGAEIISFDAGADLFLAIESGQIDAILQDLPVNVERAAQDDTLAVIETYETDENYGFAFPKGSPLVAPVNDALAALRGNGTYDAIFNEYFTA